MVVASGTPAYADSPRDREWWLEPLKIAAAQQQSQGEGVIVGLVDTPVDSTHPDLAGRVLPGHGYKGGDPANGWGRGQASAHGTSMAGLIVGNSKDANPYKGIAPRAKVLPFGSIDLKAEPWADGIRWLTDNGAKVINLSVGAPRAASAQDAAAVRYAIDHDVVVVAAAGNVGKTGRQVVSPASIPGVVAVSGADNVGDAWDGSARGPEVVLAAPATQIISPEPLDFSPHGYGIGDGTSQATAIVSGVVALIRSKYPKLNAASVIERLIKTAKDNGDPGRDKRFGFGTIRPLDALTANVAPVEKNPLGEPGSATDPGSTSSPSAEGKPNESSSVLIPALLVGGGLLFLVLIIVLVVVVSSRGRKPQPIAPPQYPPGWQPPQAGPPHVPHQHQPNQQQYPPPPGT